jgi:hypothetical protein
VAVVDNNLPQTLRMALMQGQRRIRYSQSCVNSVEM